MEQERERKEIPMARAASSNRRPAFPLMYFESLLLLLLLLVAHAMRIYVLGPSGRFCGRDCGVAQLSPAWFKNGFIYSFFLIRIIEFSRLILRINY